MGKKNQGTTGEAAAAAQANVEGEWAPLVDWSQVFPGNRGVGRDDVYELYDAPLGVKLAVEPCRKTEPILTAQPPWERADDGGGSLEPLKVWRQDGTYRMLYYAYATSPNAPRRFAGKGDAPKFGGMGYAVSEDGYSWTRPELGLAEVDGSRANNKVHPAPCGGFVMDPSAPPDQRFKAMELAGSSFDPDTGEELDGEEAYRRFQAMEREGPAYTGPKMVSRSWMNGWTSPDGIHWTKLDKPVADIPSDTANVAHWDAERQLYFAYFRTVAANRRSLAYGETKDFHNWPKPEPVLVPDCLDDPEVSFYGGDFFPYPGRSDLFGMFVWLYHQAGDGIDVQIAFSRDRLRWDRPERRPVIPVGEPGSGEDCLVRNFGGLFELPDGLWASAYHGESWLHNAAHTIMKPGAGQIRLALWRPHRFCGVQTDHEGRFTICTVERRGKGLRLNYRCAPGGWIAAELTRGIPSRLNPDADAIPGFSFDEADRLTGDSLDAPLTWNGRSDLSGVGDAVAIRIRMFQAKLFAYSI